MQAWDSPRVACEHDSALTQRCGTCGRWCCISCYSPWMALTCTACRTSALAPVPHAVCARPARTRRCREHAPIDSHFDGG